MDPMEYYYVYIGVIIGVVGLIISVKWVYEGLKDGEAQRKLIKALKEEVLRLRGLLDPEVLAEHDEVNSLNKWSPHPLKGRFVFIPEDKEE